MNSFLLTKYCIIGCLVSECAFKIVLDENEIKYKQRKIDVKIGGNAGT